jgi:hypothetical protein
MERTMGIEPSSYSPDVVEIADDKYDHRPKPSVSMAEKSLSSVALPSGRPALARTHVRILGTFHFKDKTPDGRRKLHQETGF